MRSSFQSPRVDRSKHQGSRPGEVGCNGSRKRESSESVGLAAAGSRPSPTFVHMTNINQSSYPENATKFRLKITHQNSVCWISSILSCKSGTLGYRCRRCSAHSSKTSLRFSFILSANMLGSFPYLHPFVVCRQNSCNLALWVLIDRTCHNRSLHGGGA